MIGWIVLSYCVLMLAFFCALAVIWLREEMDKQEDAQAYWAGQGEPADDLAENLSREEILKVTDHLHPCGATAIHHIDGDPSNNDPDNIVLVLVSEYRTNFGRQMRGDS